MDKKQNYYSLEKKTMRVWERIKNIILIPFKLPSWIVSLVLARNITHIALNPSCVPEQRAIHLTKTSHVEGDDVVIVNFKKRPRVKWINDLLIKISDELISIPLLSPHLRSMLHYNHIDDKKHVDELLEEIDKLANGTSTQKHCENRTFDWAHIHFKGLEFLDTEMRAYFYEQLDSKHGSASYLEQRKTNIEFFTLKTANNSELDSVEVIGPGEEAKLMSERKFVITCIARDQNFISWIKDLNYTADKLGATAVSFNYRGIDYSRGVVWTESNLISDILAQTERLIKLGATPENICLDGMCLSGALTTIAAAKLHQQGYKVKLNNERSFTSIPKLVFGFIAPELQNAHWWNPLTYALFILAALAYLIVAPLVWLAGWHVDAASAWNKIPAKDKIYSVVRDEDKGLYDGVIHDQFSSIAGLADAQKTSIFHKLQAGKVLTEEEKDIINEDSRTHHFKPCARHLNHPKYPGAHFISRQDLVAGLGHKPPYSNHDYFLEKLKEKFDATETPLQVNALADEGIEPDSTAMYESRPLIIACSGGTGHISAAEGIINELKANNPHIEINDHQAVLYKNKPITIMGVLLRLGILVMSIPILGRIINGLCHVFKAPVLPDSRYFWDQMSKIERKEMEVTPDGTVGRYRPYIDMLLDIYPAGYEYTAINNATHLSLGINDIKYLTTYKGVTEGHNHRAVITKILQALTTAAKKDEPYTRVISTQALSLNSICDAVIYYNKVFLPEFNAKKHKSLPPISIDQYMTDLPALGCAHFMENLYNLTAEQRQLIEVHTVYMSEPIKEAYFGPGHGFKGVHTIDPHKNPMVRNGFKKSDLSTFTKKNESHELRFKTYTKNPSHGCSTSSTETITIEPDAKTASIMIGSLASTASADYAKHLLDNNYHPIFIFGGLNLDLSNRVEQIIQSYPDEQQADLRSKIICLGNQTDLEMAPIMTRSDCIIIRGGGLSVMEQMSMPMMDGKMILMHHDDSNGGELTSGLSWEDSNTDRLIEYFTEQGRFAMKTSPALCAEAIQKGMAFHQTNSQAPRPPLEFEQPKTPHLSAACVEPPLKRSVLLGQHGLYRRRPSPVDPGQEPTASFGCQA